MSELTKEQVEALLTKPAGIRSSLEAERACIAVLAHEAALRAKVEAFEHCQDEVARNLGWNESQQLTKQSFILQQLATLTAERDRLLKDVRKLDALEAMGVDNWEGYEDAMDTLRGEGG